MTYASAFSLAQMNDALIAAAVYKSKLVSSAPQAEASDESTESQDPMVVPYVATADNMADFFTKALPPARFYSMRNKIMNVPPDDALAARGKAHGLALRAMFARAAEATARNACRAVSVHHSI